MSNISAELTGQKASFTMPFANAFAGASIKKENC